MDKFLIEGGRPLSGAIKVSGAKNAALPLMCAALLTQESLQLNNLPDLHDIKTMLKLLAQMGVQAEHSTDNKKIAGSNSVVLNASRLDKPFAPYRLVKTMRAAILALGPLLARCGIARVSLPGGCAIGARPVDQHIKGLKAMGASIRVAKGYIQASLAAPAHRLRGARLLTDVVTVTGTENLMMAACLAEGETVIENAAREPEVVDLANCLNKMGAQIDGAGSDLICIQGVKRLSGTSYRIMPDRIEAGTYLCAAAASGGEILVEGMGGDYLEAVIGKLRAVGCHIQLENNAIHLKAPTRLNAISFLCAPYPAFPTDMQAQFMAVNALSEGSAVIRETIFENRFMHAVELNRLGANIRVDGNTAFVNGVSHLEGAKVMATDLRASAGLVIAGLAARGCTEIERIYHLDRGYESMEHKLTGLGACVSRVRAD